MNIIEQLEILKAVNENKKIEYQQKATKTNDWYPISFPKENNYNFKSFNYRIKQNQPTILHQYIIKDKSGDYKLSIFFYKSLEEAQENTQETVIKAAEWTRIEIQE